MPAKYTHDVVATIGEYKDRQTGETKKRFLNVGKAFTDDDGGISLKLDCIPSGPEWSGWFRLYAPRDGGQRTVPAPAPAAAPARPQGQPYRPQATSDDGGGNPW